MYLPTEPAATAAACRGRGRRAALALALGGAAVLGLSLSACTTIRIEEKDVIRPDRYRRPDAVLDAGRLVPGAKVADQTLALPQGPVLGGVTVAQGRHPVALLYFGGNSFQLDRHGARVLPPMLACGVDVTVFDYRGFGRSQGQATVAAMADDALRVYDHVRARHPGGVVVHGHSLGSFIAAHVAAQRPDVRGLVLETTATNAQDWAQRNVPWYVRPFVRVELADALKGVDNQTSARKYQGPALVLAAGKDRMTPAELGRKVYEALPGTGKRWVLVEQAGHNSVLHDAQAHATYCDFVRGSAATGAAPPSS
jgi:hypothetical protein